MNRDQLYRLLTAANSPIDTISMLRGSFFPEIMRRFNADDSRRRFGLYQNEKIPLNERNLTDVRTRMGVLIEFELARISNILLQEAEINDVFWSYVVANRFPDLEVRKTSGERMLRLEIKCLQCVAEEKSANFDTLIKDIDPSTDYVVVCLWDWFKDPSPNCNWDSVPKLVKIYVFHAYSLTKLRDTYWLNNPPSNLGGGYQGFDTRFAVTCANGLYSKEQGNYGKLTRIWKDGFAHRPVENDEILDTEREYLAFQREIILEGFIVLSKNQLAELSDSAIEEVIVDDNFVGYKSGHFLYLLTSLLGTRRQTDLFYQLSIETSTDTVVAMTERYRCSVYHVEHGSLILKVQNEKPKIVVDVINHF